MPRRRRTFGGTLLGWECLVISGRNTRGPQGTQLMTCPRVSQKTLQTIQTDWKFGISQAAVPSYPRSQTIVLVEESWSWYRDSTQSLHLSEAPDSGSWQTPGEIPKTERSFWYKTQSHRDVCHGVSRESLLPFSELSMCSSLRPPHSPTLVFYLSRGIQVEKVRLIEPWKETVKVRWQSLTLDRVLSQLEWFAFTGADHMKGIKTEIRMDETLLCSKLT